MALSRVNWLACSGFRPLPSAFVARPIASNDASLKVEHINTKHPAADLVRAFRAVTPAVVDELFGVAGSFDDEDAPGQLRQTYAADRSCPEIS